MYQGMAENQHMPGGHHHGHGGHDHHHTKDWEAGLCGCLSHMSGCLCSWCCPCIQYGRVYDHLNGGGCCVQSILFAVLMSLHLEWLLHCSLRGSIRNRHNISGGCCSDFLATFCCPCCALMQETKEVNLPEHHHGHHHH